MSKIEWTDATWNPVRGCSRVSEGCRNCYAERMAARNLPGMRSPTTGKPFAKMRADDARWTGDVELIPSKLDEPLRWRDARPKLGRPLRVFVNSMSDLFHEALPDEALAVVFGVMGAAPQHTFQILTKRPKRMREWMVWAGETFSGEPADGLVYDLVSDAHDAILATGGKRPTFDKRVMGTWPLPNVWLGVSLEDQATADERIPLLLQTPAAVRFVSYEPALGPVDFAEHFSGAPQQTASREYVSREMAVDAGNPSMEGSLYRDEEWEQTMPRPDWLIVGGESGPGARPFDVAWARSVVRQCREAGVACFVKQLGRHPRCPDSDRNGSEVLPGGALQPVLLLSDSKGGDPSEWPEDLRVREFPA
jgi:protein gp37